MSCLACCSVQFDDIRLMKNLPKCLANCKNQITFCWGLILTWVLNSLIDAENYKHKAVVCQTNTITASHHCHYAGPSPMTKEPQ